MRLYHERDYFRLDPVVRAGVKGFLPLDWSDVDRASLEAPAFFRKAEAHGVGRQGLTLPVRGPAGERALFTVTANVSASDWQANRLDRMRDFQILAHFVHDHAVTLAGYRPRQAQLSARELQCLAQVAAGRHIKQVAADLSLSISAVHLYLRSVRNKLKAANLTEAVVKAIRLELLSGLWYCSNISALVSQF